MEYYRSEIKTGIMAMICIAILVITTFYVGGSRMWGTTVNLNVVFKNVGGLEPDAPVHYAGLEVGMVKDIRIMTKEEKEKFPDCSILAKIELDKLVEVKEDSEVLIKTLGFMGLKYIDITPGSNESGVVPAEGIIKGKIPGDMDEVMESIQATITDLKKLIKDADEVIVVNKEDINKIITNLSVATEHLKVFAEDIKHHPWKLLIKTPEKKKKEAAETKKPKEHKSFWRKKE